MAAPTRWEIALGLLALATAIYLLIDAGSWAEASRFVRALSVASAGAALVMGFKIVAIGMQKGRASDTVAKGRKGK